MAIAGMVLSLAGFLFLGFFIYTSYVMAAPARLFTEAFIQDLAAGRTDAARLKCDPHVFEDDCLNWSEQVQAVASPVRIECTQPLYQAVHRGRERRFAYTLAVTVSDARGKSQTFSVALLRNDGVFSLWNFEQTN